MRFIATADWQLGMTAHYLPDEARARYQQARLDAVRRVGEVAREHDAQFIVVCGDVFEHNQLDRRIVSRALEALRTVSVPVVLVPGNHDPLDAASIYDAPAFAAAPPGVRVARDATPFEVVPGVEVVGVPWRSKEPTTDLVAAACADLERPASGVVRVLAAHGAVSTLNPDRDSMDTIDTAGLQTILATGLAHVVVLGDRHTTTKVDDRIWYPGTPEVTHRREEDPGNVLVIDVDPASGAVGVEPVHVGRWRFLTVERELMGDSDVDALAADLESLPDKDRTAVWLALKGTLSTAQMARLDAVLDAAGDLFARLDHWSRHKDLHVLADDADFGRLGLSGFAQDALEELLSRAQGGEEQSAVAGDALALLYRLAGGVA